MNFLQKMYDLSRARAEELPEIAAGGFAIRSFKAALKEMAIIAEVKYATPAEGKLGITESPAELARIYQENGARAISCLTEPEYFLGQLDYLRQIREVSDLPILHKDFITDERQIAAGRAMGADAFLLICEMLQLDELTRLYKYGRSLGMDALIEIHGLDGLKKAQIIGAEIIGVNVRDLASLKVFPERHEELISLLSTDVVRVAESGISSGQCLQDLKSAGYDAALIGRAVVNANSREGIFQCG